MVKEVEYVMEVRDGLLALAYPMVRFSLMNDREGRRKMGLNTLRVDSSVEVFCGVFDNKLGDSVQYEDREEQLKVSGFLSSPPTSRAFSAVSCTEGGP